MTATTTTTPPQHDDMLLQAYLEQHDMERHHIRSFDTFITRDMVHVIEKSNPLFVTPEGEHRYRIDNVRLMKPSLTPRSALRSGETYRSLLVADIITHDASGHKTTDIKRDVAIASIPMMVGSKVCSSAGGGGGYFILNGERCILRPKTRMLRDDYDSTESFVVRKNQRTHRLYVHHEEITSMSKPIPLFVLFRAFGIVSDLRILQLITWRRHILPSDFRLLYPSIKHAADMNIFTQQDALDWLGKYGGEWSRGGFVNDMSLFRIGMLAYRTILGNKGKDGGCSGSRLRIDDAGAQFARMFENMYKSFVLAFDPNNTKIQCDKPLVEQLLSSSSLHKLPGVARLADFNMLDVTSSVVDNCVLSAHVGMICPHTLQLASTCCITPACMTETEVGTILESMDPDMNLYVPLNQIHINKYAGMELIYINDVLEAVSPNPVKLVRRIRELRREDKMHRQVSVSWNILNRTIHIWSDSGRLCRPLVNSTMIGIDDEDKKTPADKKKKRTWSDMLSQGRVEYIDTYEQHTCLVSTDKQNADSRSTHYEMHPSALLSLHAIAYLPFVNHATATPLQHQDQDRSLAYVQEPLVTCSLFDRHILAGNGGGAGQTVAIAIMSYAGQNQLGGVIVNQAALDRGMLQFQQNNRQQQPFAICWDDGSLHPITCTLPPEDMPFCPKTGFVPDIIINPHDALNHVPMILQCITSKVAVLSRASRSNHIPFGDESVMAQLQNDRHARTCDTLTDPRSGRCYSNRRHTITTGLLYITATRDKTSPSAPSSSNIAKAVGLGLASHLYESQSESFMSQEQTLMLLNALSLRADLVKDTRG